MQSVWFTSIWLVVAVVGLMLIEQRVLSEILPFKVILTPTIYYLHIKSDIRFRFATTVVTSKIVNPDVQAHQTTFQVTLPNEAFITNFTLTVGNNTYVGDVKWKEEARQQYESAVSQGRTAAHISVRPRETNRFDIEVNVAAEQKLTFELRYQELLQRKLGSYNHVIYIKPGEPVQDMRVDVDIFESRAITNLQVPPIRNDILTDIDITATNEVAIVDRISDRRVHIRYEPSIEQQTKGDQGGLDGQFWVTYDVDRRNDGGDLLMVNGYFVHFFAPSGLEPRPKNVVFILDKSGSMSGRKIKQLKGAMLTILSQMDPVDNFNILPFDSRVIQWKSEQLVPASRDNIAEAKSYVKGIRANGGTNIQDGLLVGISLLERQFNSTRSSVIIFLTDGQSGKTNPSNIVARVVKRNEDRVPVFSLAFGANADYNLVKRLAAQNNGFGRKIYEDSDADIQISNFYAEVSTVLLQNVTFSYLGGSGERENIVDRETMICDLTPTLLRGSEMVVTGRISNEAATTNLLPLVTGTGANGLISLIVPDTEITTELDITQNTDVYAITEKLWAYLTIKQWIKQMEASADESEQESWKKNITAMALKYNFVTPLTSMVVTLPDELQVSPVEVEEDDLDFGEESMHVHRQHGVGSAMFGGNAGAISRQSFMPPQRPPLRTHVAFDRSRLVARMPPRRKKHRKNKHRAIPSRLNSRRRNPQPTFSIIPRTTSMRTHQPTTMSTIQMTTTTRTPQPTTRDTIQRATTTITPQPTTRSTMQRGITTRTIHQTTTTAAELTTKTPTGRKLSKMLRARTKASDYTLVTAKGVELPLCFRNPGDQSVDTTTMYNLTRDSDTGISVSVGYTFHGRGRRRRTRITRILINTTNTTTEMVPGFRIEDGVRQQTPAHSLFEVEGRNLKWEVVNQKNMLSLLADFTTNTNQNIEGSLVIPIQGDVRVKGRPRRNRTKAKLILKVQRGGVTKKLKTRVTFSKPMQCWVIKTKLMLDI